MKKFSPACSPADVAALVSFLDDASEQTVALAKTHLKQILRQKPAYRSLLHNPKDPELAHRAQLFLEENRLEELKEAFAALAAQGQNLDLERGTILLAQFEYPTLRGSMISRQLDRLAKKVEALSETPEGSWPRDVMILRHYLFDHLGFCGNEDNYYDPDNSYLHRVLQRKTGIPISLSCIYLFVARRLNFHVFGVGLPGHFVVAHQASPGIVYIDPFQRGKILTRNDCMAIVRRRGIPFQETFLAPTPDHQILTRMIANLVNVYTEQQRADKAQWLTQILSLFENVL